MFNPERLACVVFARDDWKIVTKGQNMRAFLAHPLHNVYPSIIYHDRYEYQLTVNLKTLDPRVYCSSKLASRLIKIKNRMPIVDRSTNVRFRESCLFFSYCTEIKTHIRSSCTTPLYPKGSSPRFIARYIVGVCPTYDIKESLPIPPL